ncbi:MAG: sugar phosphate isomerase/epimerase family protein [Paracoccaceae bacterium]
MQTLEIYQSLWAMQPHGPDGVVVPVERAFEMVTDAGYDGMAIDLGVADSDAARATRPLFEKTGLGCLIMAFPKTVEGLRPVLHMAKDFGAIGVNVIGQVPALTLTEMVPVLRAWIDIADQEGVPVQFETHRNCITNDLYTTLELIDTIPEMRLCADLSHFLVDREFWYPISDYDDALIQRILARSDSFQGRVSSREQIQVPIGFPQNQKWYDLFARWWEDGFRAWRARNPVGVCNFLCELGPPEYAITGADGRELSNRWEEALHIRERVRGIWAHLETET